MCHFVCRSLSKKQCCLSQSEFIKLKCLCVCVLKPGQKYCCMSFCVSQSEQEVGLMLSVNLYVAVCKQNNNFLCHFVYRNLKLEVMSAGTLYVVFQGAHVKRNVRKAFRKVTIYRPRNRGTISASGFGIFLHICTVFR